MIEVRNVSKFYGNFLALDDISFEIGAGEIVALLGPNGAGKTTTMRILTGFMPPTKGDVKIDGMDISEDASKVKSLIGYLPENPPVYPELTVREYLSFIAEIKGVEKNRINERVDQSIEMADLKNRKNTMIGFLSKGLKQRVGIAQSIVNSPKVLVLDEPTVGLDPVQVVEMRSFIKGLASREKRTIILSTHLLTEAQEICEKAIIINNGKIIAVDSIDNLRSIHLSGMRLRLQVNQMSDRLMQALRQTDGVQEAVAEGDFVSLNLARDIRAEIAKKVVDCGSGLLEMKHDGGTLEDIFIKLVQ